MEKCNKCQTLLKHVLMPYDEYELLCPVCDMGERKDPLNGRKENDLIKKELLLEW